MDEMGITDIKDSSKLISTWAAEVEGLLNELEQKLNDAYTLVEHGMDYLHPDCDDGREKLEKAMELIDDAASRLEGI